MDTNLKDKKILLIGGSGFIGLHLAKRISEVGGEVAILYKDNIIRNRIGFEKKIELIQGDVADYEIVEKSVKDKDIIVNLAAIINPLGKFDPYEDWEVNGKGQLNILKARRKVNPNSKHIFLGTRAQFGKVKEDDMPIAEDYPQNPISLYGIHKQAAENYCKLYNRAFNLKSIILRPSIVYGPPIAEENKHDVIYKFIKKALGEETFYINGFGKDIKDMVYVADIVDLLVKVMGSKVDEGTFNVGSGKKIELIEIANKIIKLCKKGNFKAVPFPKELENFELGSYYANISKVKRTFKWEPKTSLEEGIKKIIEFQKSKRPSQ